MAPRACKARRPDGTPCPNHAAEGSDYCTFHQPDRMRQQAQEFTQQFKRELMHQGVLSILRRRFWDIVFGLVLLFGTGLVSAGLLSSLPDVDVSLGSVLLFGCVLKLPIVLTGVFLFRQRQMIGLVIPLFYVPLDLLGALYYQTTGYSTASLSAYYQMYWDTPVAVSIAAVSVCCAVAGTLLGKRL